LEKYRKLVPIGFGGVAPFGMQDLGMGKVKKIFF
jgi:hypothetical protein